MNVGMYETNRRDFRVDYPGPWCGSHLRDTVCLWAFQSSCGLVCRGRSRGHLRGDAQPDSDSALQSCSWTPNILVHRKSTPPRMDRSRRGLNALRASSESAGIDSLDRDTRRDVVLREQKDLAGRSRGNTMRYIKSLDEITIRDAAKVGGKALNCACLRQAGFPVPDGFVLTAGATEDPGFTAELDRGLGRCEQIARC